MSVALVLCLFFLFSLFVFVSLFEFYFWFCFVCLFSVPRLLTQHIKKQKLFRSGETNFSTLIWIISNVSFLYFWILIDICDRAMPFVFEILNGAFTDCLQFKEWSIPLVRKNCILSPILPLETWPNI